MKASDFIMNTDYLTIAQVRKNTFSLVLPPGQVPAGGQVRKTWDFAIQAENGALDQTMIKLDSNDFKIGNSLSHGYGTIDVGRTTATNFRAEVTINNLFSSTVLNYPTMTFTIRVVTFKPPNVF